MKPYIKKIKESEKFITLKQAAQISGYSSDYIGQLIRQGKIDGKQVYCNIAWVTTETEIRKYMSGKERGEDPSVIRGHYLRVKHNLSDWLFSFSPTMIVKSFLYSFLILISLTSGLIFLSGLLDESTTKISQPEITRVVEYDKDSKRIITTTDLPYLP